MALISHQLEKRAGGKVNAPKFITTFEGDDRIKFIHSDNVKDEETSQKLFESLSDLENFDIYDFIDLCFQVVASNGGVLRFLGKDLTSVYVINSALYANIATSIYVEWSQGFYYLNDLIEHEISLS